MTEAMEMEDTFKDVVEMNRRTGYITALNDVAKILREKMSDPKTSVSEAKALLDIFGEVIRLSGVKVDDES